MAKKIEKLNTYTALKHIREQEGLSSGEKAVLFALASRMNQDGTCYPGLELLAQDSGYKNAKTASKIINQLQSKGLLHIEARNKGYGKKQTNLYSFPFLNNDTQVTVTDNPLEGKELQKWILSLVCNFIGGKLTHKALAKFWYTLRDQFFPDIPKATLGQYDQKALNDILSWCNDAENSPGTYVTLCAIGFGAAHWHFIRANIKQNEGYAAKPPKHLSPVAIRDNFDSIYEYTKKEFYPTADDYG